MTFPETGINYNDTFAPSGDKVILRLLFSWTSTHPGYFKETVSMSHPEGFGDGSG
jgi:hypothetical protein